MLCSREGRSLWGPLYTLRRPRSVSASSLTALNSLCRLCNTLLFCLGYIQLFATPGTVARQAPPSTGFPRQEYWNGLPFPFSRGSFLPRDQTRVSCTQADSLPSESPGKPNLYLRESIGIDGEAIREATLVTQLVKNLPTMQETPV